MSVLWISDVHESEDSVLKVAYAILMTCGLCANNVALYSRIMQVAQVQCRSQVKHMASTAMCLKWTSLIFSSV
jgi:hypothetical protein